MEDPRLPKPDSVFAEFKRRLQAVTTLEELDALEVEFGLKSDPLIRNLFERYEGAESLDDLKRMVGELTPEEKALVEQVELVPYEPPAQEGKTDPLIRYLNMRSMVSWKREQLTKPSNSA